MKRDDIEKMLRDGLAQHDSNLAPDHETANPTNGPAAAGCSFSSPEDAAGSDAAEPVAYVMFESLTISPDLTGAEAEIRENESPADIRDFRAIGAVVLNAIDEVALVAVEHDRRTLHVLWHTQSGSGSASSGQSGSPAGSRERIEFNVRFSLRTANMISDSTDDSGLSLLVVGRTGESEPVDGSAVETSGRAQHPLSASWEEFTAAATREMNEASNDQSHLADWLFSLEERGWCPSEIEYVDRRELTSTAFERHSVHVVVESPAEGDDNAEDVVPSPSLQFADVNNAGAAADQPGAQHSHALTPGPNRATAWRITFGGAMAALILFAISIVVWQSGSDNTPVIDTPDDTDTTGIALAFTRVQLVEMPTLRSGDDPIATQEATAFRIRVATDSPAWLQLVVVDSNGERWIVPIEDAEPYEEDAGSTLPETRQSISTDTEDRETDDTPAVDPTAVGARFSDGQRDTLIDVPLQVADEAGRSIGAILIARPHTSGPLSIETLLDLLPDPIVEPPFTLAELDARVEEHVRNFESSVEAVCAWRRLAVDQDQDQPLPGDG